MIKKKDRERKEKKKVPLDRQQGGRRCTNRDKFSSDGAVATSATSRATC